MGQSFGDWLRRKIIRLLGGVVEEPDGSTANRLLFVNDEERVKQLKLAEYNIWYEGDSDELLNFYTRNMLFDFNFEPFYDRNKRNYFWAISSVEAQIKRTHSGLPRDIVDTLVSIMPFPLVKAGKFDADDDAINKKVQAIIDENDLPFIYRSEQMPLALVEGWGCYKLIWDAGSSDLPIIQYYRAKDVDFIYKNKRICGVVYKDFYQYDNKRYLLVETRFNDRRADENGVMRPCLIVNSELFSAPEGVDYINPVPLNTIPELKDLEPCLICWDVNVLFSVPVIFFKNTDGLKGFHGRSILTGKLDLLDDLDQDLSQSSTGIKLSTPIEYFNTEYLERDKNGMPKRPSSYDRKYLAYEGQRDSEGNPIGDPVIVTQPRLDTRQYSDHAMSTMLQIMNGIMSPATLGIDIAKKDNAEAQREKEKVTIFTRNTLIAREEYILRSLLNQALILCELMNKNTVSVKDYDISIKFSEFADASYENKLDALGKALAGETMSPKMYMQKLYGNTLSESEYAEELRWIEEHHEARNDAINEGMAGIAGDGENLVEQQINTVEE